VYVGFFANLLGSLGRLYTTVNELGQDPILMSSFAISIALNAVMIAQILYYGKASRRRV